MSDALAIAAVLLVGATLWRAAARYQAALPALPGAVAGGTLAVTAWLSMLQLAGIRWSPVALAVPVVAAAGLLLARAAASRRREERLRAWLGWGRRAGGDPGRAPGIGRYGRRLGLPLHLGAQGAAFALGGGHDAAWLAWPGHVFAHPGYPPAWTDLLAVVVALGGDVDAGAALAGRSLVAALAVVCWGPPIPRVRGSARSLRSSAPGAPVLVLPAYAGYAEPLLASSP